MGRYHKWIDYYGPRLANFGCSQLVLIDDGTPLSRLRKLGLPIIDADRKLPKALPGLAVVFRFNRHLGRSSVANYPGWWRSFSYSSQIAKRYDFQKLIHIESDAYVIGKALAHHMKGLKDGWSVLWCPRYRFPECSIQVLGGRSINGLESFWNGGLPFWTKKRLDIQADMAEKILPFTNVIKQFKGDRYGEYRRTVPRHADFVCQAVSAMRFDTYLTP